MCPIFQPGFTRLQSVEMRLRRMCQARNKTFGTYLPYIQGKTGLEIGGPSAIFQRGSLVPIYEQLGALDNCDFSKSTVWAEHTECFIFDRQKKPGRILLCDGSALVEVPASAYDVLLSSHNLEHFANPIKALKEWQRVLKAKGALVLILPYYRATFDHRREPTKVEHMFEDFEQVIGEDDLTHLPEILDRHDLSRDIAAGSRDSFYKRSLENLSNRCLHHHVFDEINSRELLAAIGFEVLSVELALPHHICILARNDEGVQDEHHGAGH